MFISWTKALKSSFKFVILLSNAHVKYLHGIPWDSMEFYGNPWKSMEIHGIPWNFHGVSMEFHGVSMECHGVTPSSMKH